jgi:AcrR family transcriptional regulator
MTAINLKRRAEIGREKRARTRARLVEAAAHLYARHAIEMVTVDEVVRQAGVAKGTFYVHFDDLDELTTAVAEELVDHFEQLLQPQRLAIGDPVQRVAVGCFSFFRKALSDPWWAALVARMAVAVPTVGQTARQHLLEDLRTAAKEHALADISPGLAFEVVAGTVLQLLRAFGEGRLTRSDARPAVASILRAIGVADKRVRSTLAQLSEIEPPSATASLSGGKPSRASSTKLHQQPR